jgi:hypothetical protein
MGKRRAGEDENAGADHLDAHREDRGSCDGRDRAGDEDECAADPTRL